MKKMLLLLCAIPLFCAPSAGAVDFGIDLRIKAGADIPPPIIVADPPLFLVPPTLGFQVAVGVPFDMFLIDGRFYLHKGGAWHIAPGYNGPWKVVEHRHLPPGLDKRSMETIGRTRTGTGASPTGRRKRRGAATAMEKGKAKGTVR